MQPILIYIRDSAWRVICNSMLWTVFILMGAAIVSEGAVVSDVTWAEVRFISLWAPMVVVALMVEAVNVSGDGIEYLIRRRDSAKGACCEEDDGR